MARILLIEASARGESSLSNRVAGTLIDAARETHENLDIDRLNVWDEDIPEFRGGVVKSGASYRLDEASVSDAEEAQSWARTKGVFERFNQADAYVIASPMWNFGVPYRLKQYFDVMAQPDLAFNYTSDGPVGHVTGKPAALVVARGGSYVPGSPFAAMDHQLPWLETMLRFIGFQDIETIAIEPTIGAPDDVARVLNIATHRAREIGGAFKF